jgi:hypothetical protein
MRNRPDFLILQRRTKILILNGKWTDSLIREDRKRRKWRLCLRLPFSTLGFRSNVCKLRIILFSRKLSNKDTALNVTPATMITAILQPPRVLHIQILLKTPLPESASELYLPSERLLSAKLAPTFVDRGVLRCQRGRSTTAEISAL